MAIDDGGCAPTPLQQSGLILGQDERDYYRQTIARLTARIQEHNWADELAAVVSHPAGTLTDMDANGWDTKGETWLTPYEGLMRESVLPELGILVLVGSDMDTGRRNVVYQVTGANEECADVLVALGAVEYVKGQLGGRVA